MKELDAYTLDRLGQARVFPIGVAMFRGGVARGLDMRHVVRFTGTAAGAGSGVPDGMCP